MVLLSIVKVGDIGTLSALMTPSFRQFRCSLLDTTLHFTAESGGDMSITNSNSNFGNTALRSAGFKAKSFSKDKAGEITHIIPPKALNVISTTATGANGEANITLANDGSVNGVIQGVRVTGANIGAGAIVQSVNYNTRVVTLSVNNTDAVNGNVIFLVKKLPSTGSTLIFNELRRLIRRLRHKEEHLELGCISMDIRLRHHLQQLECRVTPLVRVKMARVLLLSPTKSIAC